MPGSRLIAKSLGASSGTKSRNVSDDVVSADLGTQTGCPAGTEVSVQNFDISLAALDNDDFFIWLN